MRNPIALFLAAMAGALLPWVAVALYGQLALVQNEHRVVFAMGSIEHTLALAAVFFLPALALGAGVAAAAPKSLLTPVVVLAGACATATWLLQTVSLSLPGLIATSISLPLGVLVGALFVGGLRA